MPSTITARPDDAVVLCWSMPGALDVRTQQIAAFLGIDAPGVALEPALRARMPANELVARGACVIADVETLAKAADRLAGGANTIARFATDACVQLFVHGFRPTDRHRAVLRALSSGALTDIAPHTGSGAPYQVTDGERDLCGQFSGLSVGTAHASDCVFLEADRAPRAVSLVRIGHHPFFARVKSGASNVFLLGCEQPVDLAAHTRRDQWLTLFAGFAPLAMFLRGALGDRVWTNREPRACFTIDDPLLKHRYGFMKYSRLVAAMRRRRFSTSIAFIPWNHRRSRRAVASLLSSGDGVPSLCVHGCDHTDREFAADDLDMLHGKAKLALERMRAHHARSGVRFDDVMVFPQGRFSCHAITALKAAGYLATVNGDVYPTEAATTLTARDLLSVAVTRFNDFPLFGRRYPRDIAEFAFDLFVGKPALAVEHHGYFRNGCESLEAFVDDLSRLDSRLVWTNLATICSRASLTKTTGDCLRVRFFTSRFTLQNQNTRSHEYVLLRQRSASAVPARVTIDGREVPYTLSADDVQISATLEAGQTAFIEVFPDLSGIDPSSWKPTAPYRFKVLARRVVGELRDNYVDPARALLGRFSAVEYGSMPEGAGSRQ